MVYNDFYIGEGADVVIVAGCGIHNCGTDTSEHDGIHTFLSEKMLRLNILKSTMEKVMERARRFLIQQQLSI